MTIHLLGVGHDANSSFLRGAAEAPAAIRAALASPSANMGSEAGYDFGDPGNLVDAGDVAVAGLEGVAAYRAINAAAAAQLDAGRTLLVLGGDHSVSHPVIMAHADRHPRLSILHFDAHADLYDDFDGNPFSHASPFARLMESGRIARLVQIGLRTQTVHLREQGRRFAVEQHEMHCLPGPAEIVFDGPVYVTFDLDALDPAFAPGVSHHEPGGLTTREALSLVNGFRGRVIGGDVVELNPQRDINGMSAMVAAKLVKELAARMLADRSA